MREVPDEELRRILEDHEKWLAAEDKTGLDRLRADLSFAQLPRSTLYLGRNMYLEAGPLLSEARLQKAKLSYAELPEAAQAA